MEEKDCNYKENDSENADKLLNLFFSDRKEEVEAEINEALSNYACQYKSGYINDSLKKEIIYRLIKNSTKYEVLRKYGDDKSYKFDFFIAQKNNDRISAAVEFSILRGSRNDEAIWGRYIISLMNNKIFNPIFLKGYEKILFFLFIYRNDTKQFKIISRIISNKN